tara:strand:+ start:9453 stop:10019 length:567 start_codon:yes stop_codon:yes gene_type:complete
MVIDKNTGLISSATYFQSPNKDERPGQELSLLVIHGISLPPGQFHGDDIKDFFLNKLDSSKHVFYQKISNFKVSSHLVIRRDGRVWQFVPFHQRAWHAGISQFGGRDKCNDFSIGIELEGIDTMPYSEEQYCALSACTTEIMKTYPGITMDRIVGHEHIAPGRKTDPGPAFDWAYYHSQLLSVENNIK